MKTGTESKRAKIERDLRKFLRAGGKVQEVPIGMGKDAARNMQWKAMSIESASKAGL
jgi:hypothetical protein